MDDVARRNLRFRGDSERFGGLQKKCLEETSLRIQICPKKGISPIIYSGDGMFRPSILLDREGSGFLGLQQLNQIHGNLPASSIRDLE